MRLYMCLRVLVCSETSCVVLVFAHRRSVFYYILCTTKQGLFLVVDPHFSVVVATELILFVIANNIVR